jgi:hypothetical protein
MRLKKPLREIPRFPLKQEPILGRSSFHVMPMDKQLMLVNIATTVA